MSNTGFEMTIQTLDSALLSGDIERIEDLLKSLDDRSLTDEQREIVEKRWIFFLWSSGEHEAAYRRLKQLFKKGIQASEGSPDWIDLKLIKSYLESLQGHIKGAVNSLKDILAVKNTPETSIRWVKLNLSCLYRDKGQWDDAEKLLISLTDDPDSTPEMKTRAALVLAEMLSDFRREPISHWLDLVEREAPSWGGWEWLMTARILSALEKVRRAEYGVGLENLYKYLNESNQSDYLRPGIRVRLALAEAMLRLGVSDDIESYLIETKQYFDCMSSGGLKHLQFEAERLWAEITLAFSDDKSKLLDALDRMEILLAVAAKYPKPPGAVPFWLTIGRLQYALGHPDTALRAFDRARREAQKCRSKYFETLALYHHANTEWQDLLEKIQKIPPAKRNKILSETSEALDAVSTLDTPEIKWRLHFLRGSILRKSGDEYPAEQEFHTAARILLTVINAIPDQAFRRAYLNRDEMVKTIDVLNPFIEKIREKPVQEEKKAVVESRLRDEERSDSTGNTGIFKAMIAALYDIQSASSRRSLIFNWLKHVREILEVNEVRIRLIPAMASEEEAFVVDETGELLNDATRIPHVWINEAKVSRSPARFVVEPNENIPEKRNVLVVPLIRNGTYHGVMVLARTFSRNVFGIEELELLSTLNNAALIVYSTVRIQERLADLTAELRKEVVPEFSHIIGESEQMKSLFLQIQKVAPSNIPITIIGETGTGKDLIARTIHDISIRKDRPFVYLDCSAIPMTLLEAELFGIRKGVATGVDSRIGLLEYADGGTIVLDEVSDIPLNVQAKLLRVLQEQEFQPIGSSKTIRVDIRIISTSTVDLMQAVKEKRIREDFFYRISGVTINVPPLRHRGGDIILLARVFLEKYNREFGKDITGFTPGALEILKTYPWPGNVRELDHHIRKAVLFCKKKRIDFNDLDLSEFSEPEGSLKTYLRQREQEIVMEVVNLAGGDISEAASVLEISKNRIRKILNRIENSE